MKEKEKLGKKIRRALELDELLGSADGLELRGTEELTVRGCKRILHYSEEEVRLSLNGYVLRIYGNSLYCASYYSGTVCVSGDISALEFEKRGEKQ